MKKVLIGCLLILSSCAKREKPLCNYCHTAIVFEKNNTVAPYSTKDTNICNDPTGSIKNAYIINNSKKVDYSDHSFTSNTTCQY